MIRKVSITGFKRFASLTLEFRPLTVFAGRNGAGKTSAIHALLLVQHAARRNDGVAELNGPFGLELGWFGDLINVNSKENAFAIAIQGDEDSGRWTFSEGDTEMYASVSGPTRPDGTPHVLQRTSRAFQYLSAERDGPHITQKASALPIEFLEVGCRGEFCSQVIEKLGSSLVEDGRLAPVDDAPPLLKAQTEQWLSKIARPVQIDTSSFGGTDVVAMTFREPEGTWVRPPNMGYGVSYSLPVVLAALIAPVDGLLIVENPEAHLHPAGQSEIGQFLARMAASGVQVVIETHSDHVLNGIRRAIGELKILQTTSAIVHFFSDNDPIVEALYFTDTGGISSWPSGFMDQYQLDVSSITKIRRER